MQCSGKAGPAHAPEPRGPPAPPRLPTAHPHARCSQGPHGRPADTSAPVSGAAPPSAGRDMSVSLVLASSRAGQRRHQQISVCMQPAPQLLPTCPKGALLSSSCPHSTGRPEGPSGGTASRALPSPLHLPVALAMSTALYLPAHSPHVPLLNVLCCCSAVTRQASPRPHRVPSSHGTGSLRLRLWPSQEVGEAVRTQA